MLTNRTKYVMCHFPSNGDLFDKRKHRYVLLLEWLGIRYTWNEGSGERGKN